MAYPVGLDLNAAKLPPEGPLQHRRQKGLQSGGGGIRLMAAEGKELQQS